MNLNIRRMASGRDKGSKGASRPNAGLRLAKGGCVVVHVGKLPPLCTMGAVERAKFVARTYPDV